MKIISLSMLFASIALVILTLTAFRTAAEETSKSVIEIRLVMAGITQDTDPSCPFRLSPEAILRTGDKIKMYLKAGSKCSFYFFHNNQDGILSLLYPDSFPSEALTKGTRLIVPQGDQWFELDEQTGTETFHVLVSPTPLRSIETLYHDYEQHAHEYQYPATRLLSAIERLRKNQHPLTSKAERPISVGGTIRGEDKKLRVTMEDHLDQLAEDISITSVFCRTYKIEHH